MKEWRAEGEQGGGKEGRRGSKREEGREGGREKKERDEEEKKREKREKLEGAELLVKVRGTLLSCMPSLYRFKVQSCTSK